MNLRDSGTIQVDGYNVRRTAANQWLITKAGEVVSYVDMLSEVYPAIDYHVARVRARSARAEADAAQARERAAWDKTLLDFGKIEDMATHDGQWQPNKGSQLHLGNGNSLSF